MRPPSETAAHTPRLSTAQHHRTKMAGRQDFSIRWTRLIFKMALLVVVASLGVPSVAAAPGPLPYPSPRPVAAPGPSPYPVARPYPAARPAPRPQAQRQQVSDTAIESALQDKRYLTHQLKCALGEAPCDPVGRRLKTLAPLVLRGSCPQCSPSEVRQIQKVLSYIQRNYPREWGKLVREYAG